MLRPLKEDISECLTSQKKKKKTLRDTFALPLSLKKKKLKWHKILISHSYLFKK